MGSSVFFGGSVVAAVIAGSVSLFAPCCISIMLPAYLSSAFQNRRVLVAMTLLFAAGVATVILPLAVGATFLERLFVSQHTLIYAVAGALLIALSGYLLLGGRLHLPMPGRRASGRKGPLAVYSLGAFSGITSSCCAPVLAGVLALSGVAGSFGKAVPPWWSSRCFGSALTGARAGCFARGRSAGAWVTSVGRSAVRRSPARSCWRSWASRRS